MLALGADFSVENSVEIEVGVGNPAQTSYRVGSVNSIFVFNGLKDIAFIQKATFLNLLLKRQFSTKPEWGGLKGEGSK